MKNLILWIVIAVSLYTALYLIHKRALEKSVFRQLYQHYKGFEKVSSEVIRGTVPVYINVNLPGDSVCSVWNHGKCILVPVFGSGSGDRRDFIRGHPVGKDL